MPNPQHDQRLNVLAAGDKGGWTRDSGVFDESNIVRDTFTGPLGQVRVAWIRTPWSLSGRFAGALFSEPEDEDGSQRLEGHGHGWSHRATWRDTAMSNGSARPLTPGDVADGAFAGILGQVAATVPRIESEPGVTAIVGRG